MEAKTLLVTGGTGYIGSHTVVEVLEAPNRMGFDKIVIIDNLDNSNVGVLKNIEKITGHKLDQDFFFEECDIRDKQRLTEIFTKFKHIHSVIHFAGLKAVGVSVSQPLQYYDNNVGGTIAMLQVMQEFGCNNIIFSSSATVYGSQNPHAKEDDPVNNADISNPYGQTKAMIEVILKDYAFSNKDFSAICLRYFNPIGAHKSGLIGEDPEGIPNNLMPYIQRIAGGKLPHLTVFGNDYNTRDGTGVRDYIHVTDLAKGHLASLDKQANLQGWHTFNLGTGTGTTVLELVAAFEEVSGLKIQTIMGPRRPGDVD